MELYILYNICDAYQSLFIIISADDRIMCRSTLQDVMYCNDLHNIWINNELFPLPDDIIFVSPLFLAVSIANSYWSLGKGGETEKLTVI